MGIELLVDERKCHIYSTSIGRFKVIAHLRSTVLKSSGLPCSSHDLLI